MIEENLHAGSPRLPEASPPVAKDNFRLNETTLAQLLDKLPALITGPVRSFDYFSEQKIAIFGTVTAASCIVNSFYGVYLKRRIYAALYTAIVAGPSSNKGILSYIRKLLEPIHRHFKQHSDAAMLHHLTEQRVFNQVDRRGNAGDPPIEPPYRIVIISGDITAAKLIQQLEANGKDVPCIIIESEIDTIVVSGTGEHGKALSRIFRNCYHHEAVTQQLKTNNRHYEIYEPILSMLIAGTPGQLAKLIGSIENGLYSRFTVLTLDDGPTWMDVSPCENCPDRDTDFATYGVQYLEMWEYLQDRNIEVRLQLHQWQAINEFGSAQLGLHYNLTNEALAAVVKRHCLMIYKTAMVITGVRYYEDRQTDTVVYCSDADFESAMMLIKHSLSCAIEFFQKLPGGSKTNTTIKKENLLLALPDSFTRAEAVETGKNLKISVRQVDRYLLHFTESCLLEKTGQGNYIKLPMATWQKDDNL